MNRANLFPLLIVAARLRVQEKTTCGFIALSFRSDLVDLIEQDRKCSLSYSEDIASEERPKVAWK